MVNHGWKEWMCSMLAVEEAYYPKYVAVLNISQTRIDITTTFQSLARVGGNTLGIDASPSNITIASLHASRDPFLPFKAEDTGLEALSIQSGPSARPGSLRYRHTSAEQLHAEGRQFDLVCSMEVLEHVDQPGEFLKVLGDMVKVST